MGRERTLGNPVCSSTPGGPTATERSDDEAGAEMDQVESKLWSSRRARSEYEMMGLRVLKRVDAMGCDLCGGGRGALESELSCRGVSNNSPSSRQDGFMRAGEKIHIHSYSFPKHMT